MVGKFVKYLHLIGFYNIFNPQTREISWFVYLAVSCYKLPCRLGRQGRQPATSAEPDENSPEQL